MVISDGGVMFTKVTQAYDVLSDPCTRAMYDLVVGVIPDTKEERARINRMKRKDAERAVALMEETVQVSVERESVNQNTHQASTLDTFALKTCHPRAHCRVLLRKNVKRMASSSSMAVMAACGKCPRRAPAST